MEKDTVYILRKYSSSSGYGNSGKITDLEEESRQQ